eukprot:gene35745-42298_t
MKALNILMAAMVAVTRVMVVALRAIKVSSLNLCSVAANIAKVVVVAILAR